MLLRLSRNICKGLIKWMYCLAGMCLFHGPMDCFSNPYNGEAQTKYLIWRKGRIGTDRARNHRQFLVFNGESFHHKLVPSVDTLVLLDQVLLASCSRFAGGSISFFFVHQENKYIIILYIKKHGKNTAYLMWMTL